MCIFNIILYIVLIVIIYGVRFEFSIDNLVIYVSYGSKFKYNLYYYL